MTKRPLRGVATKGTIPDNIQAATEELKPEIDEHKQMKLENINNESLTSGFLLKSLEKKLNEKNNFFA